MAKAKLSRFELNKRARKVLARHRADLRLLHFSVYGRMLKLTGSLVKDGGREFAFENVEKMVAEISRLGLRIDTDLDNWQISEGQISKKGEKDSKTASGKKVTGKQSGTVEVKGPETYYIDLDDLDDVG